MSALVWLLDRALALVSYPVLALAVLTGVFYNARGFGWLHDAARRVHIEVAVLASLVTLGHAAVGVLDAALVVTGQVPHPAYSTGYLLGGVVVGLGAVVLLTVAVLAFTDAARFRRPWGPSVVHAFAYAGFAFATVHAAAIGTDVVGLIRPLLVSALAFLAYALALRIAVDRGVVSRPAVR